MINNLVISDALATARYIQRLSLSMTEALNHPEGLRPCDIILLAAAAETIAERADNILHLLD